MMTSEYVLVLALSGAMVLLDMRLQTKVGGSEKASPSSCISKRRITDGWLRFSAGPYLGQKGNLSVEPTWEVVFACCFSKHSPVVELPFQHADTRVLVI
jgi:hypothetical protein